MHTSRGPDTAGLLERKSVNVGEKNFDKLSQETKINSYTLHRSRFHGSFSLDEISLKLDSPRHLILGSKDSFSRCTRLFSMKLWKDRLGISHHDSPCYGKLKTGIGECQVILVALGNHEIILKFQYQVPVPGTR